MLAGAAKDGASGCLRNLPIQQDGQLVPKDKIHLKALEGPTTGDVVAVLIILWFLLKIMNQKKNSPSLGSLLKKKGEGTIP